MAHRVSWAWEDPDDKEWDEYWKTVKKNIKIKVVRRMEEVYLPPFDVGLDERGEPKVAP